MKKQSKTLKITLIVLVVILISLVSFGGILVKNQNRFKNLLPEYNTGMEFSGKRVFSIKPDETVNKEYYDKEGNKVESSSIEEGKESEYETKEIPVNSKDILTQENYNKTKEIIEKRLQIAGIKEYEIRKNDDNGEMYISIPEDTNTNTIISNITQIGDFKITDSQDENNVLISSEHVKDVKVDITSQYSIQAIVIDIQFDKEGAKKLQEISKLYRGQTIEDENNDENSDSTSATQKTKQIDITLDGTKLLSTYFSEEVKDGSLKLTIGSQSSNGSQEELQKSLFQALNLAALLKTENMPIIYKVDSNLFMQSDFKTNDIHGLIIACIVAIAILTIYTILKYKKQGFLLMISQIGFIASLLLIIRCAKVELSITGIFAIVISSIISYLFIMKILKQTKLEENSLGKVAKEAITINVPILIIAVVFSFISYLPIASFGMVMFYAMMLMIVYHGIITRNLIIKK